MDALGRIRQFHQATSEAVDMRGTLRTAAASLKTWSERMLELDAVEYTGWFVLLRRNGETWECAGIVDPEADEVPEEWSVCLPIPKPETMPEFEGW